MNDMERNQEDITACERACRDRTDIVPNRGEHKGLDRADDGERGVPVMVFTEQLKRMDASRSTSLPFKPMATPPLASSHIPH